jgi:PAS domain-containing protein
MAFGAGKVTFEALRNGRKIGEQSTAIERRGAERIVRTLAVLAVKVGPLTVYRYRHEATERWEVDRFMRLETLTNQNGKPLRTSAQRDSDGVAIVDSTGRRVRASAATAPFSHWNREIAGRPLFNPQTGKLLRITASAPQPAPIRLANGGAIPGVRISFRGDAEIDNFYDETGAWAGLVGKLEDGSKLEYRRL